MPRSAVVCGLTLLLSTACGAGGGGGGDGVEFGLKGWGEIGLALLFVCEDDEGTTAMAMVEEKEPSCGDGPVFPADCEDMAPMIEDLQCGGVVSNNRTATLTVSFNDIPDGDDLEGLSTELITRATCYEEDPEEAELADLDGSAALSQVGGKSALLELDTSVLSGTVELTVCPQ